MVTLMLSLRRLVMKSLTTLKNPEMDSIILALRLQFFKAGNSSELTMSKAHETEGGDTNVDTQQKPFFASIKRFSFNHINTFEEWVRLGIIN